ncbi:MAG: trypsin-like peptidase domain-containing protein [Deltaproteobacteria bacterium]|nr:trypsin-like peptidase domain-containing protein [Deltaproteobacteria bacterium]
MKTRAALHTGFAGWNAVRGPRHCVAGVVLVTLAALVLAPAAAWALRWQAATGPGQPALCLTDAGRCLAPDDAASRPASMSEGAGFTAAPDCGGAQQAAPQVGERVEVRIDSGAHAASAAGPTRIFDDVVEVEGAPWLRLHFENVVLVRGDRIEIRATDASGEFDVLTRRDFRAGRGASRYLGTGSVSVALFVGPYARVSRFVVAEVQHGYAGDRSLVPTPRSICDQRDSRVASYNDRVCLLVAERGVCGMDTSVECWCPSSTGGAPEACRDNICQGGTRAGLACGAVVCPVANSADPRCVARTFVGTAFFIEPGINKNLCLLTAGHLMFQEGKSYPRQRNLSATLICGVYGCGLDGDGKPIDCNMATHTCPAGLHAGKSCTDQTLGGGLEQYRAKLLDGEQLEVTLPGQSGAPHDWALLQVRPNVQHDAFGLSDAFGDREGAVVIGHGSDSGPRQMDVMQQSASGRAIRESDSDVIDHFVDTEPGTSGSPLVLPDGSVLGIHVEGPAAHGDCRTSDNPNKAVFVHHKHAAGDRGRALEAALKRCPGARPVAAHMNMQKRIEDDPLPGARVAYQIKITGKGLETNPSVLRDMLPPDLVFESVEVDPPEVLKTAPAAPGADGVLSLDLAPYRGTVLVHVHTRISDTVAVGAVITNRAELRIAGAMVASAKVRFTIMGVDRSGTGLSLRLACPDHVAWDFNKNRSADVSCELSYAGVSDPSVAGNTNQLTLALPVDGAGLAIFKLLIPSGLAGGVLNGDDTKLAWANLPAPSGKLRIRGSFSGLPDGFAHWSAALVDNSVARGVRATGDIIALTEVGLPLDLGWKTPPVAVKPGDPYGPFGIYYSGLIGSGTIDVNFCSGGPGWEISLPILVDSRLSAAEIAAIQVQVWQNCLVSVSNLPPTRNRTLLLKVQARLKASTPAGPIRVVTAQILDGGRSGTAATASISLEVSTR